MACGSGLRRVFAGCASAGRGRSSGRHATRRLPPDAQTGIPGCRRRPDQVGRRIPARPERAFPAPRRSVQSGTGGRPAKPDRHAHPVSPTAQRLARGGRGNHRLPTRVGRFRVPSLQQHLSGDGRRPHGEKPAGPGRGPASGVGPSARPWRPDRAPAGRIDLRARKNRLPPGLQDAALRDGALWFLGTQDRCGDRHRPLRPAPRGQRKVRAGRGARFRRLLGSAHVAAGRTGPVRGGARGGGASDPGGRPQSHGERHRPGVRSRSAHDAEQRGARGRQRGRLVQCRLRRALPAGHHLERRRLHAHGAVGHHHQHGFRIAGHGGFDQRGRQLDQQTRQQRLQRRDVLFPHRPEPALPAVARLRRRHRHPGGFDPGRFRRRRRRRQLLVRAERQPSRLRPRRRGRRRRRRRHPARVRACHHVRHQPFFQRRQRRFRRHRRRLRRLLGRIVQLGPAPTAASSIRPGRFPGTATAPTPGRAGSST